MNCRPTVWCCLRRMRRPCSATSPSSSGSLEETEKVQFLEMFDAGYALRRYLITMDNKTSLNASPHVCSANVFMKWPEQHQFSCRCTCVISKKLATALGHDCKLSGNDRVIGQKLPIARVRGLRVALQTQINSPVWLFNPFTATGYFDIPPPRWPTFLVTLFPILKEGMGLSLLDEFEVQYHVIKK